MPGVEGQWDFYPNLRLKIKHTLSACGPPGPLWIRPCQEASDSLKEMTCFTINFNLLQLIMF